MPGREAQAVCGVLQTDLGATALGTTVADAYTLKGDITSFTGGAGNSGFKPPVNSEVGDEFEVANWSGATLIAYPAAADGQINNNAAGTGINAADKKTIKIKLIAPKKWMAVLSA